MKCHGNGYLYKYTLYQFWYILCLSCKQRIKRKNTGLKYDSNVHFISLNGYGPEAALIWLSPIMHPLILLRQHGFQYPRWWNLISWNIRNHPVWNNNSLVVCVICCMLFPYQKYLVMCMKTLHLHALNILGKLFSIEVRRAIKYGNMVNLWLWLKEWISRLFCAIWWVSGFNWTQYYNINVASLIRTKIAEQTNKMFNNHF